MLRSIARRMVSKASRMLDGDRARSGNDVPSWSAYAPLNELLLKMMREGRGVLRPNYTWGVLHAAHLARALGIERISAIELGVAGGNGLYALESAAERVSRALGVGIDVYGFDMGSGLPRPTDYRDLPNLYNEGAFEMRHELLRKRLKSAELILGPVKETVPQFLERRPAPLGFVSVDLDYYSSTMDAFQLFEADHALLLPRVHCYFDDILGFTCSEFTGERLAITEFNESHEKRKISPIFGLKHWLPARYRESTWAEMMFLAHFFDHPLYGKPDGLLRPEAERSTDLATRVLEERPEPAFANSGTPNHAG